MAISSTKDIQETTIDWERVKNFTPSLYEEYIRVPKWELDGSKFYGAGDYDLYWTSYAKQLYQSSKAKIGDWHTQARAASDGIERLVEGGVGIFDVASTLAAQPIPFATAQIQETVALLSSNPPRPIVTALQESQLQYVQAINQLISMELEANDYDTIVPECHYDKQFFNLCILKPTVDPFSRGPYGQEGKICIERIDPFSIFFDPLCKKIHWDYMDYVIQVHEMEIGELRKQYPYTGFDIADDTVEIMNTELVDSRNTSDYVQSPQPKLAREVAVNRQKIQLLECWFKDARLKFEPELLADTSLPYDERFRLDKDGHIIGKWVPRYPNGRLIVTAGGKVLKDVPNPYSHGQCPFIFIQAAPVRRAYTTGVAPKIMVVTRKINDINKRIHNYYQSEIERPMHMDAGAIASPELRDNIPSTSKFVVEKIQGKELMRPVAQDIPQGAFVFQNNMHQALDTISGSSAVMRGNLSDGAQLSAEAMSALQNFASSRLMLEAKYFNAGVKQLGYQLMWLIRQTYDQNIKVSTKGPDGTEILIDWTSDRAVFEKNDPTEIDKLRSKEDYLVVIKAGSGNPGAQAQQQAQAMELFRENAIDREALLDSLEYPQRQLILKRMRDKEMQDIRLKAEAKEVGVKVDDTLKQNRPGRRTKQ